MDTLREFHPTRSKYIVFTLDYLVPTLICLGIVALIYVALYSPFFKITTLHCFLDFEPCKDPSILAELDKFKGQNIFMLSSGTVAARFTSGNFTIRTAEVHRELPSTLSLDLQSVYPVVALQVQGDPTWVVMDAKFRVIGTRTIDPNVPTVIVPGPLTFTVGKPIDMGIITDTLNLARRLFDELFIVKTITLIDENTVELTLSSGMRAILTPKKDELTQLRALQTVLGNATILKGVKTIDVRFAQPVLR